LPSGLSISGLWINKHGSGSGEQPVKACLAQGELHASLGRPRERPCRDAPLRYSSGSLVLALGQKAQEPPEHTCSKDNRVQGPYRMS